MHRVLRSIGRLTTGRGVVEVRTGSLAEDDFVVVGAGVDARLGVRAFLPISVVVRKTVRRLERTRYGIGRF